MCLFLEEANSGNSDHILNINQLWCSDFKEKLVILCQIKFISRDFKLKKFQPKWFWISKNGFRFFSHSCSFRMNSELSSSLGLAYALYRDASVISYSFSLPFYIRKFHGSIKWWSLVGLVCWSFRNLLRKKLISEISTIGIIF